MHPVLIIGAVALAGYLLDQHRASTVRAQEREKRQLRRIKQRRSRILAQHRAQATQSALEATKRMIGILKAERIAAAQARDRLPWRSPERERAHQLVQTLSRRLDSLFKKKQKLYESR